MLSPAIGARVDRFLHDRPPTDRTKNLHLIALTFDDGPYPVETGLLLDVLAELRVPATFFLIGHDTEMYPGLAKRIVADGHEQAGEHRPQRGDVFAADSAGEAVCVGLILLTIG